MLRTPPSGGLCGADPINICNPPPCSLLPKLLPSCLSQGPESVELVGVAPGFYDIYSNSCIYVKRSFLNICAFSLLPRLFAPPAQGQRGRSVGERHMSPPGGAFRGGCHLQRVVAWCLKWAHSMHPTPREAILSVTGLIPLAMYMRARLGRRPYPLGPQATVLAPT